MHNNLIFRQELLLFVWSQFFPPLPFSVGRSVRHVGASVGSGGAVSFRQEAAFTLDGSTKGLNE